MSKPTSKTAPPSVQALAQMRGGAVAVPEPIRAYLASTLGQIDAVEGDPDSLWAIGERALQMETAGKILAGKAFVELRQSLPPREFAAGLAERHIPRRSAYFAIDAWQMFSALPDLTSVQALGQIGVTKALALRHLDPAEHRALVDGEEVRGLTLDQLVEMSSRDLQQQQREWMLAHDDQVKRLERDKARLQNELDIANRLRQSLARAGAALQAEEDLPPFALTVRQEFMALTEQMSFALDNLQAISAEHLFAEVKHPEAHRYQPVAAGTAYFALQGIQARATALLQQIHKAYGKQIGQLTLDHQLTPGEIKRHIETRDQLLAAHKAAAKQRDDDRENNRPGKRGAKRK